jgi:hypothetical protein
MPKINRYWNSDPDSLVEREPPQTYELCKCCELVNQLLWKEKRMKRALWIARAEICRRFDIDRYLRNHRNSWYNENYLNWADACVAMDVKMCKAERKCRAKAEEYK